MVMSSAFSVTFTGVAVSMVMTSSEEMRPRLPPWWPDAMLVRLAFPMRSMAAASTSDASPSDMP